MTAVSSHPVFAAALRSARLSTYGNPLHATTPQPPWLSPNDTARLAIWIADRALGTPTPAESEILDEARSRLRDRAAGYLDLNVKFPKQRASLARLALAAVNRSLRTPASPKIAARMAAVLAVQLARPSGDHGALVRDLDEEVFRIEAGVLISAHGDAEIASVLFRAEAEKPGRLGHCIVRLADGRYGLVTKMRGRYRWFAGERDEILATVPDTALSDAVDTVLARDAMR